MSLVETLRPLWKFTCYSGLLPDWCHPMDDQTVFLTTLRFVSFGLLQIMLIFGMLFQLTQLVIELVNFTSVHRIIPNLIWFCTYPLGLLTSMRFFACPRELLAFFRDWTQLEELVSFSSQQVKSTRRLRMFFCIAYDFIIISMLLATRDIVLRLPQESYLFTHYKIVRDNVNPTVNVLVIWLYVFVGWVFLSLADMIPSMVFYHSASALDAVGDELEWLFDSLPKRQGVVARIGAGEWNGNKLTVGRFSQMVRTSWLRYEAVSDLVARANTLFGSIMLVNHGVNFVMVCTVLYRVLYSLRSSLEDVVAYSAPLAMFTFRILSGVVVASRLHASSLKLKVTLSRLMSRHQGSVNRYESEVLNTFLNRLNLNPLAARPLNLYEVSPSVLLTLLSLTLSYVIVLLQSH